MLDVLLGEVWSKAEAVSPRTTAPEQSEPAPAANQTQYLCRLCVHRIVMLRVSVVSLINNVNFTINAERCFSSDEVF